MAFAIISCALLAPAASAQFAPAARRLPPRLSVTPLLSPGLGEAMSLSLRVDARVLPALRAWGSWGAFILSFSCPAIAGYHCPSNTGTELTAGIDAVAPASFYVRPYAGAGVACRFGADDVISTQPVVHAGFDIELVRWLAPRAELEWSRFPVFGSEALVGIGLRIAVPGL